MIFDLRYTLPTGHGRQSHLTAPSFEAAVAAVLADYPEATNIHLATSEGDAREAKRERIQALRAKANAAHATFMKSGMADVAAWQTYRNTQALISKLERQ